MKLGMVFTIPKSMDEEAQVLSGVSCINKTRESIWSIIDNPEVLSTYTWRRLGVTAAMEVHFLPIELVALSDWQDRALGGPEAVRADIPLRYAGSNLAYACRVKHELALVLGELGQYQIWNQIPPSAAQAVRAKPELVQELDTLMQQDADIIWELIGAGR